MTAAALIPAALNPHARRREAGSRGRAPSSAPGAVGVPRIVVYLNKIDVALADDPSGELLELVEMSSA